jgi:phosphohistidine phosphatase
MKLFLMRHGEASFDAATDQDRELTDQGLQTSEAMGARLTGHPISLVLVSPYVRAQQTLAQVAPHLLASPLVEVLDDLKPDASTENAAQVIMAYAQKHQANDVLVIGHMPILGELVCEFGPQFSPTSFVPASVVELDSWEVGEAKKLEFHLPEKQPKEFL